MKFAEHCRITVIFTENPSLILLWPVKEKRKSDMLTIGKDVKFVDEYDVTYKGTLVSVLSDAHDDVRLNEGEVEYWSKKTKKYVPIREKHKDAVFFEIETKKGFHYAYRNEIV